MITSTAHKKIMAIIREELFKPLESGSIESGVAGLTVFRAWGLGKDPVLCRSDWAVSHLQIEKYTPIEPTEDVARAICRSMVVNLAGDGSLALLPVDSFTHCHQPAAEECEPS